MSKNGTDWYDIAGSFHYDDDTEWNYTVTYVDPVNGGSTGNTVSDRQPIPYYINGNTSDTDVVAINTYHAHNWYPLAAHYITGLDKATGGGRLPFAEYLYNQNALGYTNTRTLTLSGVLLGGITSGSTATGAFGYADVTAGGDNIDLDWAVDRITGEPVDLDWIRYVRVYNAVAKDLPPFGEISTEVTAIYNITDTSGSGATTATPAISVEGRSLQDLLDDGAATVTTIGNVTYYDATEYSNEYFDDSATVTASVPTGTTLYVNSNRTTGSVYVDFSASAKFVRIIAINGTLNPSITLIKLQ